MNETIPEYVLKAAHYTLYRAMVFCRNYTSSKDANLKLIYEMMDTIHTIPDILNNWSKCNISIDTLRLTFSCFDYAKWRATEYNFDPPPDLLRIFNYRLEEYQKADRL